MGREEGTSSSVPLWSYNTKHEVGKRRKRPGLLRSRASRFRHGYTTCAGSWSCVCRVSMAVSYCSLLDIGTVPTRESPTRDGVERTTHSLQKKSTDQHQDDRREYNERVLDDETHGVAIMLNIIHGSTSRIILCSFYAPRGGLGTRKFPSAM